MDKLKIIKTLSDLISTIVEMDDVQLTKYASENKFKFVQWDKLTIYSTGTIRRRDITIEYQEYG